MAKATSWSSVRRVRWRTTLNILRSRSSRNSSQGWEKKEGKKRHSGTHWHKPKLLQPSFEQFRFDCLNFLEERSKYQSPVDMKGLREEMKAVEVDDNPDKRIRRALYEVFRELPENHLKAVSYMSKGMDPMLRLAVNAAVDEIIERTPELKKRYDEIYKRLSERDRRIKKECNRIGKDQTPYLQSKRFKDDVYRRLGNRVLSYCATAKMKRISDDYKLAKYVRQRWNDKAREDWLFKKAVDLSDEVAKDAWSSFEEFEEALDRAEFERLVEQGYIDINGKPIHQGMEIG